MTGLFSDEPLALWQEPLPPPPGAADLRAERFEFTSRGDRVPGRLLLPVRRETKPPPPRMWLPTTSGK